MRLSILKTMEILDNIPFDICLKDVVKRLKMSRKNPGIEKTILDLLEGVKQIANPKALYKISYIEGREGDSVKIDGTIFMSKILKINLENAERVFPFIVTAGQELEGINKTKDDFMRVFCLDAIKEMILETAVRCLEEYLAKKFIPGKIARMNPGSLNDWPVSQQKALFSVFGNVEELIGVRLTESFVMDPIKSVSGIFFPTEVDFKSCMLCPRHSCSKRRAEYNPEMVKKYS